MKIARFEPWSTIDLLHRDLNRAGSQGTTAGWVPAVDIIEEKGRFLLRADVPGVNAADIDVSMDAGVLTVSGVRHAEERAEDVGVQRTERSTGRFLRRFTLP
jgi:HSP20 family protein